MNYRHSDVISHEVSKLRPVVLQVSCMAQKLNDRPRLRTGLAHGGNAIAAASTCLKRRLCQTLGVTSARPEVANRRYGTAFEVVEHELADRR